MHVHRGIGIAPSIDLLCDEVNVSVNQFRNVNSQRSTDLSFPTYLFYAEQRVERRNSDRKEVKRIGLKG